MKKTPKKLGKVKRRAKKAVKSKDKIEQKPVGFFRILELHERIRKELGPQKGRRKFTSKKENKGFLEKETRVVSESRNSEDSPDYSAVRRVSTHKKYEGKEYAGEVSNAYEMSERPYLSNSVANNFFLSGIKMERMVYHHAVSPSETNDVARWEIYSGSRQKNSEAIHGAYEQTTTLSHSSALAEVYVSNSSDVSIEVKVDAPSPMDASPRLVQPRNELSSVVKPQLSMEEQMVQLQKYENRAVSALQSYDSGRLDSRSVSVIDSVKQKIGYKGSCCDAKLVNALVEYQEKQGVELGVPK
jgi:hypothetical protein